MMKIDRYRQSRSPSPRCGVGLPLETGPQIDGGQTLSLTVTDIGIGFDPEAVSDFSRASLTQAPRGLGIVTSATNPKGFEQRMRSIYSTISV
jgi:hypothetical protein